MNFKKSGDNNLKYHLHTLELMMDNPFQLYHNLSLVEVDYNHA